LEAALWAIPAQRMKAGKEHRVPLSGEALALLRAVRVKGTSSFQVASVALSCRT
jgi:integrase